MPFSTIGMNKSIARIASYFVILAMIFTLPWWLPLLFMLATAFYFPRYYEAVFFGLVMDAVYAVPEAKFGGVILVSSAAALILVVTIEFLKKRLSFYI